MLRKLDKYDQTPLYQQIKKIIIDSIEKKEWNSNEKIPTELELEKHFEVSRTTIRQAITELIDENYLYRNRGVGTFVADISKRIKNNRASIMTINTSELIQINSLSPSKKILGIKKIKANKEIAYKLKVNENDDVFELQRVQYGDGFPLSFMTTYININYVPNLEKDSVELNGGLHNYLKSCGYPVACVEYQIKATNVDDEIITKYLNIKKNSANLLVENISKLKDESVIEVSYTIINSETISIPATFYYR